MHHYNGGAGGGGNGEEEKGEIQDCIVTGFKTEVSLLRSVHR